MYLLYPSVITTHDAVNHTTSDQNEIISIFEKRF
jgi:hypothetical protein